jgi:hypothetical protein
MTATEQHLRSLTDNETSRELLEDISSALDSYGITTGIYEQRDENGAPKTILIQYAGRTWKLKFQALEVIADNRED